MRTWPTVYFGNLSLLLDLEAEAEKLEATHERTKLTPATADATGFSLLNREQG